MVKQREVITKNLEDTQKFAKSFAEGITSSSVILLFGDLGAGKTSFAQGVAQALGVIQRVISPTFVIVRSYIVPENKRHIINVHHVDLYRVSNEKEIEEIGLQAMLHDPHTVVLIEWPEKLGLLLPRHYWKLTFQYLSETERKIIVQEV